MIGIARIAPFAIWILCLPVAAAAQHQHGSETLGKVHFETTCKPEVAATFDRAVALLHSFEFRYALDGFNAVLQTDPSCAMANWGIALSNWGNPFAGLKSPAVLEPGRAASQKAQTTGSPSAREKAYINAVAELFRDFEKAPQRARTLAYEQAMEELSAGFPADTEARIFYALAVTQNALPTDKTYANQLKATAIQLVRVRLVGRQRVREPAEGDGHSRAALQAIPGSPGARALHHPRVRPAGARAARRSMRPGATRRSRPMCRTPCTCHRTRSRASARGAIRSRRTPRRLTRR